MHFFQISTGLGAGNIGDEMMARAFWQALPQDWTGEVEVFPMWKEYRGGYPRQHTYVPVESGRYREAAKAGTIGLLACGTPVHEVEGLHFPMRFIAERLDAFHAAGTPVHAVGVGVDRLYTRRGRALFQKSFLPIASWTVRNEACREALLDLGVPEERILVGADWAWAYEPQQDCRAWALEYWQSLGVDPAEPMIVVNLVNLVWRNKQDFKRAVAVALDRAAAELHMKVVFLCNECRKGPEFDQAAALEVAGLMRCQATHVPGLYFSADEMIGLLSYASLTLAMRYHFAILACLAGIKTLALTRSQKIAALCSDLGLTSLRLRECTGQKLYSAFGLANPASFGQLQQRVSRNLGFVLPVY